MLFKVSLEIIYKGGQGAETTNNDIIITGGTSR